MPRSSYQVALEKGEKRVVGVNCHEESVTHDLEVMRVSHEVETEQVRALTERKAARDEDPGRRGPRPHGRGLAHRRAT